MTRRKILLVWSGPETGTSANLFKALGRVLAQRHDVREGPNDLIMGTKFWRRLHLIRRELRRWPQVLRTDTLLLHSYAALAFPSILLAWLLRKRIVIVHWDAYPITVNGNRLGGRGRAFFDRIEKFAVSLATRIVLPTEDFVAFVDHPDVRYLHLWPSLPIGKALARPIRDPSQPIRLAFVGQTNLTRGMPEAIRRLGAEAPQQFELHVFSPNPPDPDWPALAPNVAVTPRSYLARDELIAALAEMDFGLISLHPGMGQPGFPSKSFDYAAAGLPMIYTGRPLPAFEALLERTGIGVSLRSVPLDWPAVRARTAATMPEAVQAFARETELTPDKVDRALF